MSAVLPKTLKDKDMNRIFAEVPCIEDFGLSELGQLRLFYLLVRDGKSFMLFSKIKEILIVIVER